jgi:hypothetical protein
MKPELWDFLARYPLASVLAAIALALGGLGYTQQIYELWRGGIKPSQLYAAFGVLFFIAVSVMLYRFYQDSRDGSVATPASTTVHNVTSHNQSGGITAHTVNQATEPELRFGPLANRRNPDGTYTITCTMDVIAPYPPAELSLQVEAAGITSLDVRSEHAGLHMSGHSGLRDGWGFTSLISPSGRYTVTVVAAEPKFSVAHRFR